MGSAGRLVPVWEARTEADVFGYPAVSEEELKVLALCVMTAV